ncbi:MAG: zf-HC2 domain-containing protein [Fimbriimonadaceae bacterium]
MLVQNIECRIAQAQMGRYLGGLGLSDEAVAQLESHIRSCNDCSSALLTRRVELEALIALPKEDFPALQETTPQPTERPRLVDALRAIVTADGDVHPKRNSKPIAYSAALTILLVGMSFIAKDPTRLFGERAADTKLPIDRNVIKFPATTQPEVSTGGSSAIVIKAEPKETQDIFPPLFEAADRDKSIPEPGDFDAALAEFSRKNGVFKSPAVYPAASKKPIRKAPNATKSKISNFINIVEG